MNRYKTVLYLEDEEDTVFGYVEVLAETASKAEQKLEQVLLGKLGLCYDNMTSVELC